MQERERDVPSPIVYERLVVGYHGTDRSVAEEVLLGAGHLRASDNTYDWLGRGIYFWEHGVDRAWEFALEQKARNKVQDPFVVGAFIHLGRCLDLTDTAATRRVAGWYGDLMAAMDAAQTPLPINKPGPGAADDLLLRYLDCAVLNLGLQNMDESEGRTFYQSVRGVFVEGGPAYPGSGIQTKTHVQIAVRDPAVILGYFRPSD